MTRAEAADRAWEALGGFPAGLTRREWCEAAGLTASQLTRAIAYQRDLFEGPASLARLWRRGTWVYTLHASDRDMREYRR
jgi:hypothetical protein